MSRTRSAHPRATVTLRSGSMWRLRLARELPRHLLQALAVAGLLASARFAIAPPRPTIEIPARSSALSPDPAAEGFASLFARRYLSWSARVPEAQRLALAAAVGTSMEAGAGLQPPPAGSQHVQWTQIVQVREPGLGEHVYTVAAQTDSAGLLYLAVSVAREPDGKLALAGYPALVGAPASTGAVLRGHLREVDEPGLRTVLTRALRNYLARSASELAADLTVQARVSLPGLALTLGSVRSLDWFQDARAVLAVVQASDERGTQYTLAYELDVTSRSGRWEVSAIQASP